MAYKQRIYEGKDKIFELSRSKIDDFINCRRCFYLDVKLGISKPKTPPFTLNNAVDYLLKKEFDIYRAKDENHPLLEKYNLNLVPYNHSELKEWRNKGIFYFHEKTNLLIYGKVDDVWKDEKNNLYIIDYKATSTSEEISLDGGGYKDSYKREVEIYQWLFRKNYFNVSNTAYFVYVNALKDKEAFDAKLEFDVVLIPYEGDDSWVEKTIFEIYEVLNQEKIPDFNPNCDYCNYYLKVNSLKT